MNYKNHLGLYNRQTYIILYNIYSIRTTNACLVHIGLRGSILRYYMRIGSTIILAQMYQ